MKTKDMTGLKGFLVEQCINDGNIKTPFIASAIDLQTVMCRFEGGEWASVSSEKFHELMRWKESLGWELDMKMDCVELGNSDSQTVIVHDVQNLGFKDGDFIAVGRDTVLTNIDFSHELQIAAQEPEYTALERV